jgi:hypothetical protein
MTFDLTGFRGGEWGGTCGPSGRYRYTSATYITQDGAAAVEADGYFNSIWESLRVGTIIRAHMAAAAVPVVKDYRVLSRSAAGVTIAEVYATSENTANASASAELLTNPTFATDLTGWTVAGDFVWHSGGGAQATAEGFLTFDTGVAYGDPATTLYHIRLDIGANPSSSILPSLLGAGDVSIVTMQIWTPKTGIVDLYWPSPGPSNGTERFKIWAVGAVRINSASFKRITYTPNVLVGEVDARECGQLKLGGGRVDKPSLAFECFGAATTGDMGFFFEEKSSRLALSINGVKTIEFEVDPNGAINGIYGNGSNRFTVGNSTALVLQPVNGHMEFEGSSNYLPSHYPAVWTNAAYRDFEIVGYKPGTYTGIGIRFRSEASNGYEPDYIVAIHAGGAQSDAKPGLIMLDHTGATKGTWYPNGNLTCQALTASNVVYKNATVNLTAGFTATADTSLGTVSSGTVAPDPTLGGNYHAYTNNGAHTLNPPTLSAPANSASGVIEIVNGASAGAITTSGWTKVIGSFDTTNAHKFQCDYCVTPNASFLNIRAMQ